MITFRNENTDAVVKIETAWPIHGVYFEVRIQAGTTWAARLLEHALSEAFQHRVLKARREAYEDGWKDAKAKRAKRRPDEFGCHL